MAEKNKQFKKAFEEKDKRLAEKNKQLEEKDNLLEETKQAWLLKTIGMTKKVADD